MGKRFSELSEKHRAIIERQKIFFVATAASKGRVNLSPKGLDSLRVLGPRRIVWLNLTGSGNETSAHLAENPRITLMVCAFEGAPMILRAYGQGSAIHPRDPDWKELIALFPDSPGARQVVEIEVDLVQTSCGFAVPYFDFVGDRPTLVEWAEKKGPEGIARYWEEKNRVSLDGLPTGIGE